MDKGTYKAESTDNAYVADSDNVFVYWTANAGTDVCRSEAPQQWQRKGAKLYSV